MFTEFFWDKVAEYDVSGDRHCSPIRTADEQDDADENAVTQFWTVYGQKPDLTVQSLVDTDSEEDAVALTNYFNELLKG